MATVVELVIFRAALGVSEKEMTTAAKKLDAILPKFKGFLSRTFCGPVNENGEWADIVYWTDMKSAQVAAEEVMKIPEANEFFKLIDPNHMQMRHLNIN